MHLKTEEPKEFAGDYGALLNEIQRLRAPQHARRAWQGRDGFSAWWERCRDQGRKEKYGQRVRAAGFDFKGFLRVIRPDDPGQWLRNAGSADNAVQAFLIGMLQARGRRIITIPDPTAAEPADDSLVLDADSIGPGYDQHDPLVIVEFGQAVYLHRKHGPSFVLLHQSEDRKKVIAAAHVAGTQKLYWAFYERKSDSQPFQQLFAVFAGMDARALPAEPALQVERVCACEEGVSQALREAHAFLHCRVTKIQNAAQRGPVRPRRHVGARVVHEEADRIEQVIRWVKEPFLTFPRQHRTRRSTPTRREEVWRYRSVRPHERQRHYRRQRYGKGRRQVKVIEIRATIVHSAWFNGGPGDIDIQYVASRR